MSRGLTKRERIAERRRKQSVVFEAMREAQEKAEDRGQKADVKPAKPTKDQ